MSSMIRPANQKAAGKSTFAIDVQKFPNFAGLSK